MNITYLRADWHVDESGSHRKGETQGCEHSARKTAGKGEGRGRTRRGEGKLKVRSAVGGRTAAGKKRTIRGRLMGEKEKRPLGKGAMVHLKHGNEKELTQYGRRSQKIRRPKGRSLFRTNSL